MELIMYTLVNYNEQEDKTTKEFFDTYDEAFERLGCIVRNYAVTYDIPKIEIEDYYNNRAYKALFWSESYFEVKIIEDKI